MTDPNLLTSIPAVLILFLVARGFLPFSSHASTAELRDFARGMLWMVGTFMVRTFYWGTVRGIVLMVDADAWAAWRRTIDGPDYVNAAFNIGFMIGGLYLLRGFYMMIPERERSDWTWLTSPFYPGGLCVRRLARIFRHKWGSR